MWIPFHRRVVERETEKFHDLLGGSCWEWGLGDEAAFPHEEGLNRKWPAHGQMYVPRYM